MTINEDEHNEFSTTMLFFFFPAEIAEGDRQIMWAKVDWLTQNVVVEHNRKQFWLKHKSALCVKYLTDDQCDVFWPPIFCSSTTSSRSPNVCFESSTRWVIHYRLLFAILIYVNWKGCFVFFSQFFFLLSPQGEKCSAVFSTLYQAAQLFESTAPWRKGLRVTRPAEGMSRGTGVMTITICSDDS